MQSYARAEIKAVCFFLIEKKGKGRQSGIIMLE
jgi:hypothetical protein